MRRIVVAALACALVWNVVPRPASADVPSVAALDARARAGGNRKDVAEHVGLAIFATKWSAQVLQIAADGVGDHIVLGVRISGVKFHAPLTRTQFEDEVAAIVARAFAAEPSAEEVDLWAVIPIAVPKGTVVSGDLAMPTTRTVFSLSILRSQARGANLRRAISGKNAYWDEDWARLAFEQRP